MGSVVPEVLLLIPLELGLARRAVDLAHKPERERGRRWLRLNPAE